MRLKLLFFPTVLVICLAIFFGYSWPEIRNIKTANLTKKENAKTLDNIKQRNADIGVVIGQISNKIDDKKIIDSYLPSSNAEERIIGGINYLASDAGVSLTNISINKPSANVSQVTIDSVTGEQLEPINEVQFAQTTVSIFGEYDKISLFIDKLQRMALFNSVESLTIKPNEKPIGEVVNAADAANVSKNLTAEIVVKFGFLKAANYSESQIAKLDAKLDQGTINALKNYIAEKDGSVIEASLVGKNNPFFLE